MKRHIKHNKHRLPQGKLVRVGNNTWVEAKADIPDNVIIERFVARQRKNMELFRNPSKEDKFLVRPYI
jgi:hypothetical protein